MTPVRLAANAMRTRFELILHGEDDARVRAAGEEALAEIQRIEAQLSFYRPSSEIGRMNAAAADRPVRVDPRVFSLLQRARRLHEATDGAFDPTVGPLMKAWGFVGGSGRMPDAAAVEEARARTGMRLVHLDAANYTVRYERPGVLVDLGSIGKGYAIEEAAEILRELGVVSGFLHGGTSTICAIGRPPGEEVWRVAVSPSGAAVSGEEAPMAVVDLVDESLSVSAAWGKSFTEEGEEYGHVLDPRTGRPAEGAVLAAVVTSSATDSDALSTAALVLASTAPDLVAGLTGIRGGLTRLRDGTVATFGRL